MRVLTGSRVAGLCLKQSWTVITCIKQQIFLLYVFHWWPEMKLLSFFKFPSRHLELSISHFSTAYIQSNRRPNSFLFNNCLETHHLQGFPASWGWGDLSHMVRSFLLRRYSTSKIFTPPPQNLSLRKTLVYHPLCTIMHPNPLHPLK